MNGIFRIKDFSFTDFNIAILFRLVGTPTDKLKGSDVVRADTNHGSRR